MCKIEFYEKKIRSGLLEYKVVNAKGGVTNHAHDKKRNFTPTLQKSMKQYHLTSHMFLEMIVKLFQMKARKVCKYVSPISHTFSNICRCGRFLSFNFYVV